jgi:hypothetical protein
MPDSAAKFYGPAHGPLGFPMTDRAARALDQVLASLPHGKEYEYRKISTARPPTELNPGERSDVSWITTESIDRTGEVVLARGMNDGQFQSNPVVTLGHRYDLPPVGKSLWRKRVKDGAGPGGTTGIKAKTHYPPAPESWPVGQAWVPDSVFALVQSGLLQGKSIGFLPTRVHVPDAEEARRAGWEDNVRLVIDEWLLLEYACVSLPANQDALVEAVSKGAVELPCEMRQVLGLADRPLPAAATIPFTPLEEVERALRRQLEGVDLDGLVRRAVEDALDRARGRV